MQKEIGLLDEDIGFAVHPIDTCTHYTKSMLSKVSQKAEQLKQQLFQISCTDCDSTKENWVCLECQQIKCSRYVNGHMSLHNQNEDHQVGVSLRDLSLWCYKCDNYITSEQITKFQIFMSKVKFMEQQPQQDEIDQLIASLAKLDVKSKEYNYEDFVNGLRDNKFKKVVFLTGAGISVAAGIPDFRSPGGLYSTLAQYNLPRPEDVFNIQYFQKQPQAFYAVAKGFLDMKAKPVLAHQFQKILQDRNQLLRIFTQNIDGLELDAGVKQENLIQAHGHMRTAHCIKCKEEGSMKLFFEHLEKQEIYTCQSCKDKEGYVKPDVVFFGEGLPKEFFEHVIDIKEADLVIVMGTSLKVQPFASSISLAKKNVPVVLINRENVLPERDNTLFIEGDIEENVHKILEYIHKK